MTSRFVQDSVELIRHNMHRIDDSGLTPAQRARLDAGETAFLERQLEAVEARVYEKKLRELKYRTLIPVSNRDGAGAQTITYYMYTKVGMAKIIANPADDLPRSDVFASRHTQAVHVIATSFGYSTQDLRRAMFANVPLEMYKVDAARRSVRETENNITWTGDSTHNIVGLFANTNITNDQAPLNAAASSRLWANKTAEEILSDVLKIVTRVRTLTKGVHQINTLLLPIEQYNKLAGTPRATNSDTTLLGFIKQENNVYGLDTVDWLVELTGSGTGTSDQAFGYDRDPEVLELRIPMEMITHPPQFRNLEFLVPVEAENGGTVVRYPLACIKFYGI
jgi:Uncharacterized protein conserved in bacteria